MVRGNRAIRFSPPPLDERFCMKITLVGGGAHRALAIFRSAMHAPGVLDDGEIYLYDLNVRRAEAMGRLLEKTPEFARARCRVRWGDVREEALDGADVVGVIMPAASPEKFLRAEAPSAERGYISSDNVSPMGSMCGVAIAPVLLGLARDMERLCPNAWLVNFVNPVAVISGLVNNHTKIRALGVCQGYTNHYSDIPRVFGVDEPDNTIRAEAAGINHLSVILRGTYRGRDLFEQLREATGPNWKMPPLSARWTERQQAMIGRSVTQLVRVWRELGVCIFSTEGDGMIHLFYDEAVEEYRKKAHPVSEQEVATQLAQKRASRDQADVSFEAYVSRDLDAEFWDNAPAQDVRLGRADDDVFVKIFTALAGGGDLSIITSFPNRGAIAGIKDRDVVEYSQVLSGGNLTAAGRYEIPDVVHGVVGALATHQTALGDAIASGDPGELARALLTYPVRPYSKDLRAVYADLFAIFGDSIAPEFRPAADILRGSVGGDT